MRRLLCPLLPTPSHPTLLPATEAVHALRVLRLRDGDRVEAIDGRGHAVEATLHVRGEEVRLEFAHEKKLEGAGFPPITLELAVLKGDAMEWAVEKAVELGVDRLVPLLTLRTIVKTGSKGPEAFRDRWRKIADQALKQCGRPNAMQVDAPVALDEYLAHEVAQAEAPRFWCDEAKRTEATPIGQGLSVSPPRSLRLLVGPEGGWDDRERSLLARTPHTQAVTLGPWVLRAETAALAAVAMAQGAFLTSMAAPREG